MATEEKVINNTEIKCKKMDLTQKSEYKCED